MGAAGAARKAPQPGGTPSPLPWVGPFQILPVTALFHRLDGAAPHPVRTCEAGQALLVAWPRNPEAGQAKDRRVPDRSAAPVSRLCVDGLL